MNSPLSIRCAKCGSTDLHVQQVSDLSVADLLALAAAKVAAAEQPPAEAVAREAAPAPPMPMPVVLDQSVDGCMESMELAPSVNQVLDVARLHPRPVRDDQQCAWNAAAWSMPNQWRDRTSGKAGAMCEHCGQLLEVGETVKWLPQHAAPNGQGLSMHVECWQQAQQ